MYTCAQRHLSNYQSLISHTLRRSPRAARSLATIRDHPATCAAGRGAKDPPDDGRARRPRLLACAWPPAGLELAVAGSRDGCWSVSDREPSGKGLAQEAGGLACPAGGVSGPGRLEKSGTFQASVSGQPPPASIRSSRGSCARRRPRSSRKFMPVASAEKKIHG